MGGQNSLLHVVALSCAVFLYPISELLQFMFHSLTMKREKVENVNANEISFFHNVVFCILFNVLLLSLLYRSH